MFLREFGLAVHPFGISPRLDFLYKSGAFEESIAHLVYGLDSNEAIIMITGAIGTGKTMAIQSFLSHLGDRYLTALVTNTSVDAKELLKLVLEDLGVPVEPGADKSDLLIAFKKFLIASGRDGKRLIVVIDEAQNLSREALEEIRLLTNLGQGTSSRFRSSWRANLSWRRRFSVRTWPSFGSASACTTSWLRCRGGSWKSTSIIA
ncbi:MAG: AAA family ATPase [Betaproteobacteria bacterium]|nr:AAA family ATPase [Betaproteobacteria bacterium]